MKFIPDYEKAVSALIDWLREHDDYNIDLEKIGTVGMSLGATSRPGRPRSTRESNARSETGAPPIPSLSRMREP